MSDVFINLRQIYVIYGVIVYETIKAFVDTVKHCMSFFNDCCYLLTIMAFQIICSIVEIIINSDKGWHKQKQKYVFANWLLNKKLQQ